MKHRTYLIAVFAFLVAQPALAQTTASPSPSPSPSPNSPASPAAAPAFTLTPPDGWTKSDVNVTMSGVKVSALWLSPKGAGSINLGTQAAPGVALADVAKASVENLNKLSGPNAVKDSHAEKTCGGTQDGWFMSSSFVMGANTLEVEQILTVKNGNASVATYVRKQGVPEDAAARKALDSLCGQ